MFFYIVKWGILYILMFYLIHNLFIFFQDNLTTTKNKDLYNYPKEEYDKIYDILNNKNKIQNDKSNNNEVLNINNEDLNLDNFVTPGNYLNNTNENKDFNYLDKDNIKFDVSMFNKNFEKSKDTLENNNMKNELSDFLNNLNS